MKTLAQKIVADVLEIPVKGPRDVELAVYRTQATLDGFTRGLVVVGSICWAVVVWVLFWVLR